MKRCESAGTGSDDGIHGICGRPGPAAARRPSLSSAVSPGSPVHTGLHNVTEGTGGPGAHVDPLSFIEFGEFSGGMLRVGIRRQLALRFVGI